MKVFFFFSLFILSVIGARSFLLKKNLPLPKFNYLSCQGEVDEFNVSYRGQFFLVKRALPAELSDRSLWASAWRMNSYAFVNQVQYAPSLAKSIAMGPETIKIVSQELSTYPQDVNMTSEMTDHSFPESDAEYVKNLYALGSVAKGEPAIKVTYEANQTLYTCHGHGAKFNLKDLNFFIPNDPYLAQDFYPADKYPKLSLLRDKAVVKTHPCYELDMIREGKKLNPLDFSYGWKPLTEGHGSEKERFSCSSYYRLGKNIFKIAPVISSKAPAQVSSLDFSRFKVLNRPIRASIFFGASDNLKYIKLDPQEARTYVETFLSDISVADARRNLSSLGQKYDKSFIRLLIFLKNMSPYLKIHSHDVVVTSDIVKLTVKGKFNLSKKDIEIFILFSPNVPTSASYELFTYTFASKFLSSDIVVYDGHSSGGETLGRGLNLAKESIERTPAATIPPYQIFGVLACSSNGIYHKSRIPKVKGMERDIIYGLSYYSDAPANGTLSFIVATDKYLYNQSVPHFGHWANYFHTDNHFMLVNQR